MATFRPIVPNLTDPELIGADESKVNPPAKSNVVGNLTIVVSSVVLTIVVILLIWQAYKMFNDSEVPAPNDSAEARYRQQQAMRNYDARQQYREQYAERRPRAEYVERAERAERSLDDAALNHKTRPILKSGTRITNIEEETNEGNSNKGDSNKGDPNKEDSNDGNIELSEIVVDAPPDEEGWKSELLKELSEDSKSVTFLEPEQSCNFVPKSGKNKGKACGGAVVANGKCKAHNK
jgi:hypothetical protein